MPPVHDRRFRELADVFAAVSVTVLQSGHVILSCRSSTAPDKVAYVEVLDRAGQTLGDDEVTRVLGAARQLSLELADAVTGRLVDHLALRTIAGAEVNLSAVARDTGIARQTLYNRLEAAAVIPPDALADAEVQVLHPSAHRNTPTTKAAA